MRRLFREIHTLIDSQHKWCQVTEFGMNTIQGTYLDLLLESRDDSIYQGKIFPIHIKLTSDFPFSSPIIYIYNDIYHPNINQDGLFTITNWNAVHSLESLILQIYLLFNEADIKEGSCIANKKAANAYFKGGINGFKNIVKYRYLWEKFQLVYLIEKDILGTGLINHIGKFLI